MVDYDKIPKENWPYYLYLEGIANELMHVVQQKRKEMKLDLVDWIDVGVVEEPLSKLTSAIFCFVEEIVDRCRIKFFSQSPILKEGTRLWNEELEGALNTKFKYDLYIIKHNE